MRQHCLLRDAEVEVTGVGRASGDWTERKEYPILILALIRAELQGLTNEASEPEHHLLPTASCLGRKSRRQSQHRLV